jgi:hypothetical protein
MNKEQARTEPGRKQFREIQTADINNNNNNNNSNNNLSFPPAVLAFPIIY